VASFVRTASLCFVALVCWLGTRTLGAAALHERETWPDVAKRETLPAPALAPLWWLGYRELGAVVTWCRALIYYGGAGDDVADYRYLTQFIDNVITLDPKFKAVYRWAGYAVTFQQSTPTQQEFLLSLRYLELGAERFPDDYEPFWLAGLRYRLDLRTDDPDQRRRWREKGAEYVEAAMQKPNAPEDLATLAAFFRSELGQKERAIQDLKERILMTQNPDAKERMLRHLQALTDEAETESLRDSSEMLSREWKQNHPSLPLDMYLQLGPRGKGYASPDQPAILQ
jgi:hypothetical protein